MKPEATRQRTLLSPAARLQELAAASPDHVSIIDGDREFSAAEVLDQAAAIAATILDREPSGGPPIPVVAVAKRDQILGVLGVLLAGRGYTVVEVTTPQIRAHETIARLGSSLVVLDHPDQGRLVPAGIDQVVLGEGRSPVSIDSFPQPDPTQVASVIFTSGSTGRPKAVMNRYAAFCARVEQRAIDVGKLAPTIRPAISPMSFAAGSLTLYEVLVGGSIEVFDPADQDPVVFLDWLDERRLDTVLMVPSQARAMVSHLRGRRLDALTRIRTTGEPVYWSDVEALRRLGAPGLIIEAFYGSTEASHVFSNVIGPDVPIGTGLVPVGAPLPGREIRFEPVDSVPDSPAELVVVGGLIADGYFDDPALTAERFITIEDGRRAYRTGDLLIRGADGELYHRGRVDDMVKIRGLLVEPAEPERVLRSVPGVHGATVLTQPTQRGTPRLVAHLATAEDHSVTPGLVRRALAEHLPPHLVPAVFVRHDALPVTERGKVDRDQLRATPVIPWRVSPVEPPRGEMEEMVAAAVEEVADLDRVSRHDDIFELGMDSLAVQELLLIIEERVGAALAVSDLLEEPSVAGIASRLTRGDGGAVRLRANSSDQVWYNPQGRLAPLVAIAGAGATNLVFRALAQALGPDHPVLALHQHGIDRGGRPDRTVEEAARRVEVALLESGISEPLAVVGHSVGGLVAYELARGWIARQGEVHLLGLLDTGAGSAIGELVGMGEVATRLRASGWRAPLATAHWVMQGLGRRIGRQGDLARVGRYPARTQGDYDRFFEIGVRAARRYRPRPLGADVPAVLFHVANSPTENLWNDLGRVEKVEVGGDHNSMLQPPHVIAIANVIRRRLEAFGS